MVLWWMAMMAADAKAPMKGVLVGGSVALDAVFLEPRLDEHPAWMRLGPDFGFELWGTSGTRKHGFRGGIVYQMGLTPATDDVLPTMHLGGGMAFGGFWKAKKGRWGTANGAVGAGAGWVWTRNDETYVAVGPWMRAEVASGWPIGKAGAVELGPYAVLEPPIRVGDDLPWRGDYWGQIGVELTLMAFGKSHGGGSSPPPTHDPAPVQHLDPTPHGDPTPHTDPTPHDDPSPPPPRGKPGPDRAPDKPAPRGEPGPDRAPDGGGVKRPDSAPAPAPKPGGKKKKGGGKKKKGQKK
ncbi:MAG: hypothetical protein H6735_04530 [Alphaproteobacteria bacterium]|nr:hypothetical protein [Alphaproteobacteria bacterium]